MKRKEGRYIHVHAHIYLFAYQYICKYKSIWSIINAYKKYIKTLLFLDHGTVSDLKHLCILFCGVSRVSHNNITFFRAQCSQWIAGLILQSEKKCLAQPGNQERMCKTGHMIRVIHFLPSFLSPLISLSWHCLWYLYLPRNNKSSLFPFPKSCYATLTFSPWRKATLHRTDAANWFIHANSA